MLVDEEKLFLIYLFHFYHYDLNIKHDTSIPHSVMKNRMARQFTNLNIL